MNNHLLIVDGHNLLFQMFFGMPNPIINRQGRDIKGIFGFLGALKNLINMTKCDHLLVMFDKEQRNERKDILEEYKSNRVDYSLVSENENPFSILPDIYRVLDYLYIAHTEAEDVETDDVIASYAITYGDSMKITISSFDSDFFQLITDSVNVIRYRGKNSIICNKEYVEQRYGINPHQYADFKSLVGDSADNIKGVPKIGVKTAAKLLSIYSSIDSLVMHINDIKDSLKSSILDNLDLLYRNQKLIVLDNNAPIPFPIKDLIYHGFEQSTKEILFANQLL